MSTIQFNSDIAEGNNEVRIAFYANLGFFIETVQVLEYNLHKLYSYHLAVTEIEEKGVTKQNIIDICKKHDNSYKKTYTKKWTLGQMKDKLAELNVLQNDVIAAFKDINDYRNLIVHKLFQNNLVCHEFSNAENVAKYMQEKLLPMTNIVVECSRMVAKIITAYSDDLHAYKRQFGIPYEGA